MEDFSFIIQLIKTYGYPVIGIGIFLECMGVPFPGETVLVLGGVAASMGHMNLAAVIIIAASAAILGDNMGYFIGNKFGRKIIKIFEKVPFFHYKHVDQAEKFFKTHGNKTVFIGRFTAILRTYAALFSGIFKMDYRTFFLYNFSGGVLWAIVFGFLGFYIGNNLPLLGKIVGNLNFIFIVVAIAVAIFLLVRHIHAKRKDALTLDMDRTHANINNLPTYKTGAPTMNPTSTSAAGQPVNLEARQVPD